ncbi:D12 class N6 adenine-specific DNA methyltransferase [Roseibium sp. TrichSKD4]|nr:D12 class N6 adenine-specific DNA methyltransferase [Roseibium sp. TrichSKD4]
MAPRDNPQNPVMMLPTTEIPKDQGRSSQNAISPFRYPGGKGFMSAFLRQRLSSIQGVRIFAEPFCGGAGAALILLASGDVDALMLNDADLRIYSAWHAMLEETDLFISRLEQVHLDMDEWYRHRETVTNFKGSEYDFELGFSTFYMNRTTRSGIVINAGPIGGYDQSGKWKINARFNVDNLKKRILWLGNNRRRIALSNKDGLSFIDQSRRKTDPSKIFYFIDPPYVKVGGRLYLNGMSEAKHVALSDILTSGSVPNWILTYDDAPLIREIYHTQNCSSISVNYSLQSKRRENEILIEPNLV